MEHYLIEIMQIWIKLNFQHRFVNWMQRSQVHQTI